MDCRSDGGNQKRGESPVNEDFKRYPHVLALIEHYAGPIGDQSILNIIQRDSISKEDAYNFGRFIISMIEAMAVDIEKKVVVLGKVDNTDSIPDIDYEVSLFLANRGWGGVWDEICDEM